MSIASNNCRWRSLLYFILLNCVTPTVAFPQGDALIEAAGAGNLARVRTLLAAKTPVNAQNYNGDTALIAGYRNLSVVKTLLEAGADVNARNRMFDTALMLAAANGFTPDTFYNNDLASLEKHNYSGDVVKVLIDAGANVNARNQRGYSPLMMAVRSADVVRLLLAAGAEVNAKSRNKTTALIRAADLADIDVVRMLLDAGAEMEASDNQGGTALIHSAEHGSPAVVQLLVNRGANKEALDNRDIYVQDSSEKINHATALVHAAASGRVDVVKILLSSGAKFDAHDYWGNTALSLAKSNKHAEIESLLLEAGAQR